MLGCSFGLLTLGCSLTIDCALEFNCSSVLSSSLTLSCSLTLDSTPFDDMPTTIFPSTHCGSSSESNSTVSSLCHCPSSPLHFKSPDKPTCENPSQSSLLPPSLATLDNSKLKPILLCLQRGSPVGDNSGGTKTKGFGTGRGFEIGSSWLLESTRSVIALVR